MAKDYQSLLDYAKEPMSPEMQQLTGQQPGGGGQGLLDVLSAIGSGLGAVGKTIGSGLLQTLQALPEVAAYRQAALGQPEALKILKGQPAIQDFRNALKESSLKPEYQKTLSTIASFNPNAAAEAYRSLVIAQETEARTQKAQEAITGRQREALSRREATAEKTLARKEQTKAQAEPGNLLRTAIDLKILDPNDPEFSSKALGYLRDRGISLPSNPEAQDKFMEQLLKSPRLPKTPEFADQIKAFFGFGTPQKQAQPAQAPTGVRKFNPATGQLE